MTDSGTYRPAALCLLLMAMPASAHARTICTIVADVADGNVVVEQGDCRTRVTPASTFKIALAAMGFDSGFLTDAHSPTLPYREGYVDWGGDAWKQPTDPTRWLKYSVVWYSQQITQGLGTERLEHYASKFGYGNADFSGDPGKHNGLERAWISSSLKISPREQVAFLEHIVGRTLPVAPHVFDQIDRIVEVLPSGEWETHGKTGMAYPRKADESFDEARAYGWFVGWAVKGNRTLVFARLIQDEKKEPGPAGNRARDAFLEELPSLAASLK